MEVHGIASWDVAARWLDTVRIPVRLGVVSKSGPRVVSLWYLREDEMLWCATQQDAAILRYLTHESTVGFEVAVDAPPYRGVRGTATAVLDQTRGPEIIDRLVARYLTDKNQKLAGMLHKRRDSEVAVGLTITRITSWDFSARMVHEDSHWVLPPDAKL